MALSITLSQKLVCQIPDGVHNAVSGKHVPLIPSENFSASILISSLTPVTKISVLQFGSCKREMSLFGTICTAGKLGIHSLTFLLPTQWKSWAKKNLFSPKLCHHGGWLTQTKSSCSFYPFQCIKTCNLFLAPTEGWNFSGSLASTKPLLSMGDSQVSILQMLPDHD